MGDARILQHHPHPRRRIGRIEGQEGGPRPKHTEQRADEVRRSFEGHRDEAPPADAPCGEAG